VALRIRIRYRKSAPGARELAEARDSVLCDLGYLRYFCQLRCRDFLGGIRSHEAQHLLRRCLERATDSESVAWPQWLSLKMADQCLSAR
jgi:hypothetical protein